MTSGSLRPAAELVARLEAAGVAFRLDGEHLALVPGDRVTDADVAELRTHKTAVMAVLTGDDPGVESRRAVFVAALAHSPLGFLVMRRDVPAALGVCLSCGDPSGDSTKINRCWRCLAAVRLALAGAKTCGGVQ